MPSLLKDHNKILPECQKEFDNQKEDIVGLRKSMFGESGMNGILGSLKNKVTKKTLLVIAVVMSGFIVAGLTAWGSSKENISNNKESISVIQSELAHIKETTDNIEKNQMKPSELLEAIKEAIKKK